MKAKLHIPTEEYGFVEVDVEVENIDEAIALYPRDKGGLNTPEWARVRDTFVNKGEINDEDFEKLNKAQKWFIMQLQTSIRRNNK